MSCLLVFLGLRLTFGGDSIGFALSGGALLGALGILAFSREALLPAGFVLRRLLL